MRYSKKILEKGICPVCKTNGLKKSEWYHNCTAIYKSTYAYDQWNKDPTEIQTEVEYPYVIEYKCDNCKITFHTDDNSFIGEY